MDLSLLSVLFACVLLFLFADSIDTPTVMRLMKELVLQANIYLSKASEPNAKLLEKIAHYLAYLFQVFGVIHQEKAMAFNTSRGQEINQVALRICNVLH